VSVSHPHPQEQFRPIQLTALALQLCLVGFYMFKEWKNGLYC